MQPAKKKSSSQNNNNYEMHRYIIINYCTYASLYIAESSKGGDENMDQVIMPELITPKFAEVIAENPEPLIIFCITSIKEKSISNTPCY